MSYRKLTYEESLKKASADATQEVPEARKKLVYTPPPANEPLSCIDDDCVTDAEQAADQLDDQIREQLDNEDTLP